MVKSKKIFIKLLKLFVYRKIFIVAIKRFYKIKSIFFVLRYLEKKIDNLGYRVYQYRFVRKSKKVKEDSKLVEDHDRKLESYFHTSRDAKTIFMDLNKDLKL